MQIKIVPPKLTKYQKAFLYAEERFTVTEASTKVGKTFACIWWIIETALNGKRGQIFWWIAPTYAQAQIAFERIRNVFGQGAGLRYNLNELRLNMPNGTVIFFKSAVNTDNLYGEDVQAAVFDEFTRAKEEAWIALRSTLTATKGKCRLIGNYTGAKSWGHQLSKKGINTESQFDPSYKSFKITAFDAVQEGILSMEEILQAKRDLPEAAFRALYLAEGSIDECVIFTDSTVNKAFQWKATDPTAQKYISADIALQGRDNLCIIIWRGWIAEEIIIRRAEDKEGNEAKIVAELIQELARKNNIPNKNIIFDSDGVGAFLSAYIPNAVAFHGNAAPANKSHYANNRTECYYHLSKEMEKGNIWIPTNKDTRQVIEEELTATIQNQQKEKRAIVPKETIKKIIKRSPDYADALMMRAYFDIYQKTKATILWSEY